MGDLAAFVRARLDEDEATAKAWEDASWLNAGTEAVNWKPVGKREVFYDNGRSETFRVIDVSGAVSMWTEAIQVKWDTDGTRTAHIARHDPARVLREVEAKRARLALMAETTAAMDKALSDKHAGSVEQSMAIGLARAATVAVKHDAAVYSDHPDYDPAWAAAS